MIYLIYIYLDLLSQKSSHIYYKINFGEYSGNEEDIYLSFQVKTFDSYCFLEYCSMKYLL